MQTFWGVAVGLGASLTVSWLLRRWLFGVSAIDATTVASTVLILGGAALLATLFPAVRAARTDPLETLRVE